MGPFYLQGYGLELIEMERERDLARARFFAQLGYQPPSLWPVWLLGLLRWAWSRARSVGRGDVGVRRRIVAPRPPASANARAGRETVNRLRRARLHGREPYHRALWRRAALRHGRAREE